MSFRDKFLGLAKDPPSELLETKFGTVLIKAPSGRRMELFRKSLNLKEDAGWTLPLVAAVACHDPETGLPIFEPPDVAELEKVPQAAFTLIGEAVNRIAEGLSLNPTTAATVTGSDSAESSE